MLIEVKKIKERERTKLWRKEREVKEKNNHREFSANEKGKKENGGK